MADKKFDLVFKASLEVGQVKTAVASLTKSLENAGAKIPQSMSSNLNRMIQSLNTELNKLEGMTDIQLDPKNAKNVGKSYEKIFQTFQQIKAALGDILVLQELTQRSFSQVRQQTIFLRQHRLFRNIKKLWKLV